MTPKPRKPAINPLSHEGWRVWEWQSDDPKHWPRSNPGKRSHIDWLVKAPVNTCPFLPYFASRNTREA